MVWVFFFFLVGLLMNALSISPIENGSALTVWGTGKPRRQFIYSLVCVALGSTWGGDMRGWGTSAQAEPSWVVLGSTDPQGLGSSKSHLLLCRIWPGSSFGFYGNMRRWSPSFCQVRTKFQEEEGKGETMASAHHHLHSGRRR